METAPRDTAVRGLDDHPAGMYGQVARRFFYVFRGLLAKLSKLSGQFDPL